MKEICEGQALKTESLAACVEGWGYRPFERKDGGAFGYSSLLVAIRKEPTEQHFDPRRVGFRLVDSDGNVRQRIASWRTPVTETGPVCAGPIRLIDRIDKEVRFFTFGGSVRSVAEPSSYIYAFHSPGPILEFTHPPETVSDQLGHEAESILGELEELWDEHEGEPFSKRLAQIDPLALYTTIVNTILRRYEAQPSLRRAFHALYEALEDERQALRVDERWSQARLTAKELIFEAS